jgi:hypothetical protein
MQRRVLDELVVFEQEMGSTAYPTPADCFNPCYKLVLSSDYIDVPRNRASLPAWLREEKRQGLTLGEMWRDVLRQATELRQSIQRTLSEPTAPWPEEENKPPQAPMGNPGEGTGKPSAKSPKTQRPKRRKRGTAGALILETVAQLTEDYDWGKTDFELQERMAMSRTTFTDAVNNNPAVRKALRQYRSPR